MSDFIDFSREDVLKIIGFPIDIFGIIESYLRLDFKIILYLDILGIYIPRNVSGDYVEFVLINKRKHLQRKPTPTLRFSPSIYFEYESNAVFRNMLDMKNIYILCFAFHKHFSTVCNNYENVTSQ